MLSQVLHHWLARYIYTDGLAVLPRRVQARWPERQFIRRFLAQQQIDCVLDVGANIGQF